MRSAFLVNIISDIFTLFHTPRKLLRLVQHALAQLANKISDGGVSGNKASRQVLFFKQQASDVRSPAAIQIQDLLRRRISPTSVSSSSG